jgi:uncharacterized membrane protein YfcA
MFVLAQFFGVPPGVDTVTFLVVGSLASILMGAAKSGFGGSVGMLATPLMILACGHDAPLATGILLPILIACDYASIVYWWRKWEIRNIRLLVPGMIVGIGVGWVVLHWMFQSGAGQASRERASNWLDLAIGLVAVGFVVLQLVRWLRKDTRVYKPGVLDGLAAGSSAGFVSTLAHTAGPITNMYLLPQGMSKATFQATTVLYYWIGNQVKLVPYWQLNLLPRKVLLADVVFAPALMIGVVLGIFLHNRINEKTFSAVVYGLLAAIGPYLVATAGYRLWMMPT